jgi:hypothetical protein
MQKALSSRVFSGKSLRLLLTFIVSLSFSFLWLYFGEQWKVLADGEHYVKMYEGIVIEVPFAYRVLTPFLAHLLPLGVKISFAFVTIAGLTAASLMFVLYMIEIGEKFLILIIALFWTTSFAFVYYGTTLIRADAFIYFCIPLFFLLAQKNTNVLFLSLVLIIGQLAHETVLICLPMIWIDKIFASDFLGAKNYTNICL